MSLNQRTDRVFCPRCGSAFPDGFRACPYDGTQTVADDPLPGAVLGERYVLEAMLGEGGLGRVYIARHLRMPRRFAVKVPSGSAALHPRARTRFMHEAEAASRLDHPNVVSVIDFGETPEGLLYLVMELADGDTLDKHLAQKGAFKDGEALEMVRQIAMGLEHAHQRGLVHRDLKPENVIVERSDGRPRIVDFGLAILRELGDAGRLTSRGMVLGSPAYMSPEQACAQEIDHRTDVFSLGVMLFELVTGCLPFDGDVIEIIQKNVDDPLPPVAERVPGLVVDPDIEQLIQWMTQKQPASRPPRALEVAAACTEILERFAAERGVVRRRLSKATITGPGVRPATPRSNTQPPEPVDPQLRVTKKPQ